MRRSALATLGLVTLVLGAAPVPASASPFCFKDQFNRAYRLHVTGTEGPMIQVAGTETTPPSGSGGATTRIITGAAYLTGQAQAFVSIVRFKAHKDNPTSQGHPSAMTMTLEPPSYTSGVGTELSADGTETILTFSATACVNPQ
jgi:hypothetical protein